MKWYAFYVASRAEKKVAERLRLRGFEVFCPLKTEIRQWSDRKKKVQEPYFRSYVFVCLNKQQELEILRTPGVVAMVKWLNKPAIISETEMREVIAFFQKHDSQNISVQDYKIGQLLEIKQGILEAKKGVVLRQGKSKVVLEIQQVGLSLVVELSKIEVKAL